MRYTQRWRDRDVERMRGRPKNGEKIVKWSNREKKEKKRVLKGWGGSPVDVVLGVRHPVLLDDALGGQVRDGAAEPVAADVIRPGEPIPPGQAKIGDLRKGAEDGSHLFRTRTVFSLFQTHDSCDSLALIV